MSKKIKKRICLMFLSVVIISAIVTTTFFIVSNNNKKNIFDKKTNRVWNGYENISHSIIEIRDEYIEKYNKSKIKISNENAKIKISNDSYEQSNKLSNTVPVSSFSFEYEKAGKLSKYSFSKTNSINEFINKLNDSKNNEWRYEVSSWIATADQRFTGVCVLVPMYAPKVTIRHDKKIYDDFKFSILSKERNFLKNLYFNKLRAAIKDILLNDLKYDKDKTEKTLNYLDNAANLLVIDLKRSKLKPMLKNDYLNDEKIQEVSFGNFKVKYIQPKKLNFWSNNLIPITDMEYKEECRGATCSHNLRHLVDVVLTSVKDLVLENFGKTNVVNKFVTWMIGFFVQNFINEDLGRTISRIFDLNNNHGGWINDITKYVNSNVKRIMLEHFGKVEKHGIQLGKHGTLVSGVIINRENNIVDINNENNEPLILFEGENKKIFNWNFTEYNYNTMHCIKELSKYKELYAFLENQTIEKEILEILLNNIKNISVPSDEIYKMYLEYKKDKKIPIEYNVMLNSFQKFINDGWEIPNNIYTWDFLDLYIIPTILNNNIFIKENEKKIYLYKNNNFVNNTSIRNKDFIESDIYFDRDSKEIFRYENYEEIN